MTQQADVLAHLKSGRSITPIEALRDYGCFRLAAIIHDLRNMGHPIETNSITENGKTFASYRMKDSDQLYLEGLDF